MKNLRQQYVNAIKEWQNRHPEFDYLDKWNKINKFDDGKAANSVEETIWCCNNSSIKPNGILIMGINPSFNREHIDVENRNFQEICQGSAKTKYWSTKKDMVDGILDATAYLDLFPIRMTKQKDFMDDNNIPLSLKVDLLKVTRQEIESLHPRLIINPNMGSRYYWGIEKKTPWMGYEMKHFEDNPIGKQTNIYKIEKVQDNKDVICHEPTSLNGTKFLLAKYHGNGYGKGALQKEDFLKFEDIRKILDL